MKHGVLANPHQIEVLVGTLSNIQYSPRWMISFHRAMFGYGRVQRSTTCRVRWVKDGVNCTGPCYLGESIVIHPGNYPWKSKYLYASFTPKKKNTMFLPHCVGVRYTFVGTSSLFAASMVCGSGVDLKRWPDFGSARWRNTTIDPWFPEALRVILTWAFFMICSTNW